MNFMGRKSIKKLLIREADQVNIPDVRIEILNQLDKTMCDTAPASVVRRRPVLWRLSFVSCIVVAFLLFGIAISFSLPKKQYKEIKDVDRLQAVYAYQTALLSTLVNNPESVDLTNLEVSDALSNSIGFVDFVLNKDKTTSKLYQSSNSKYDYYLSTSLGEHELCKFYYKEQSISKLDNKTAIVVQGYIEIGNSRFEVFGESTLDTEGKYVMDLMLGYQDSKVCISSNESQTNSYEYRVYNQDAVCKKVSLEFKDNQIYMNVDFQNEYFKFQIQGNNNQYTGNYHTESSSGSLMIEIEKDKYNFNVDNDKSSAERYILP